MRLLPGCPQGLLNEQHQVARTVAGGRPGGGLRERDAERGDQRAQASQVQPRRQAQVARGPARRALSAARGQSPRRWPPRPWLPAPA